MVILIAIVAGVSFYFRGSEHDHEWTRDPALAERFADEEVARDDLTGSPLVYDHYVMRARDVLADATPGATAAGDK